MENHGYFKDNAWNKSDFTYTFDSGSKIEFFSADQPKKGTRTKTRHTYSLMKPTTYPMKHLHSLEIRTREVIWIDYNPVAEFWYYTEVAPNLEHDFNSNLQG